MKKVLVPIDGSAGSVKALEYIANRRKHGERFTVLVINVQPEILPSRFVPKDMIERYQNAESEKALGKANVAKLINELKADVYSDVGDAAETIVKFAKKSGCHEIIMATRGLGQVKGLLMGSTATKVVHLSPLPVTLVK
jgi:nucleotide-binding universal stress UspA family protein